MNLGNRSNFYTLKDPFSYTLVDTQASIGTSNYLVFAIKKCNNSTSVVQCADFGQNEENLVTYLKSYSLVLTTAISYVDYEDILPFEGPVESTLQYIEGLNLADLRLQKEILTTRYSLVEHKVKLQDSVFQLMASPKEFSLLNIDIGSKTTVSR